MIHIKTRRRGFTMIEAIIAGALAMALVAGMYSAFGVYFRSFHKESAILDRSREVQQILSKLRVDFSTSVPSMITPDELSAVPLEEMGWRNGASALLDLPRDHVIYHMEYEDKEAVKPARSTAHAFSETYTMQKVPPANWSAVAVNAGWQNAAPDPRISADTIPGSVGPSEAIVTVPTNIDGGEIQCFLSKGHDGLVVWVYQDYRRSQKRGRLLRWTLGTGIQDLGAGVVEMDALQLRHEWIYIRPNSVDPERLYRLRTQLEVSVSLVGPAPGSPEKPGVPMLTMEATIPREI